MNTKFGDDAPDSVLADDFARKSDGSGVLLGRFEQTLVYKTGSSITNADTSQYDGFVVGLDTAGKGQWAVQISSVAAIFPLSVVPTTDGGVVVVGTVTANATSATYAFGPIATDATTAATSGFIGKIDASGNVTWLDKLDGDAGSGHVVSSVAVDPATGDVIATGQSGGTHQTVETWTPGSPTPTSSDATGMGVWYANLGTGGVPTTQYLWPNGSVPQGLHVAVRKDGTRYLLGSYIGPFPTSPITPTPPFAVSNDGFLVTLDANDMPLAAFTYGSDDRDDYPIDLGFRDDGRAVVLFQSNAVQPPSTKAFKLGAKSLDASLFSSTSGFVVAELDATNANGVWGQTISVPAGPQTQISLAMADDAPLLSVMMQPGQTMIGQKSFVAGGKDSLFLTLDPMSGVPTNKYALGASGLDWALLVRAGCSDTIAGTFQSDPVTFGADTFTPQLPNAVVSASSNRLAFTAVP